MIITILTYPHMTPLDFIGPLQIWSNWPGSEIQLVAATPDPLPTDTVARILPTHTYDTAADAPDILFVPGGSEGTLAIMNDAPTLAFLRDRGARAGWVTSVCTGALVLGAAGLLQGYKSTTHWAALSALPAFGAEPVNARWVVDRNRASGGGVTAGIDFGLALMAKIAGEPLARLSQLLAEYAPQPPFASGTPEQAQPETLAMLDDRLEGFKRDLAAAVQGCSTQLEVGGGLHSQ